MKIPFNKPFLTGNEINYMKQALESGRLAGNGEFSRRCAGWLEQKTGCRKAILVPSGTAALEMMMILANIGPGDEVIMPSFTFSSTANAVVLRGATPVFVDIRPDTLNLDESLIEAAVTSRTKAILPVHYAGVGCDMDIILSIAERHGLLVLEDAAQCILSYYKERHLGSLGQMGALSFHETKNIQCGEGGALLINDPAFVERAEIVMEKGTDRSKFFRGEIDKYTWVDLGSSYLVNEITAAFLWAQLEEAQETIEKRMALWNQYFGAFSQEEEDGKLRRPTVPGNCRHNAHIFFLLFPDVKKRDQLMSALREKQIQTVFHYIPLEEAAAGKIYGKISAGPLSVSRSSSEKLLRLPLFPALIGEEIEEIISELKCLL